MADGGEGGGDANLEKPLKNFEYVGQCYDVLLADPIDLNKGRTGVCAFSLTVFENIPDGTASKPVGTGYQADPGGAYDHRVLELSSVYDYKASMSQEGSLNVSDPTGAAFSASLSASFTHTRNDTEKNDSIVTYTSEKLTLWDLNILSGDKAPTLSAELQDALAALPTEVSANSHDSFFSKFGTHYARRVVYGGRLTQRISVGRRDYESFLEEGVNVSANVEATFDIFKAGGKIAGQDTRSQSFKTARSVSVENITYVGGTAPQAQFDMWAMYVKDSPGPVSIDFEPLYGLLTPARFPTLVDVVKRNAALHQATDSYLSTNGHDCAHEALKSGDVIMLSAVVGDGNKCLRAEGTCTSVAMRASPPAPDFQWVVVNVTDPSSTERLQTNTPIALRNVASGAYLDAQSGSDDTYSAGDGLTAVNAKTPKADSAQWTAQLVSNQDRSELVDGDYVQFRRRWLDADGKDGYLLQDAHADAQMAEVFSFGRSGQKGTVWRIDRV